MKRVLVLNIGGLGDMVMATPALKVLAASLTEGSTIDLVTAARSAPVVERAPFIRRVFPVDLSVLTGRVTVQGVIGLFATLATLARLRWARYDLVLDLMAVESDTAAGRRKFIIDLIGPKKRVGRNTNGWVPYLDIGAPETLLSAVHEVDRKLAVLKAMGYVAAPGPLTVYSTLADAQRAQSLMETIRTTADVGTAILVPGAWRPTRRWAAQGFVAVGNHLRQRRLAVAVCGASDEHELVSFVTGRVPGAVPLLDVPPRVLFEIVRRCDIMVTNDTGPMHLAAATEKTGIVAIFGPENPRRYAPQRRAGVRVLFGGASCAPCTRYRCDDMHCLNKVTADEVIRAVDRCLDGMNTAKAEKPPKKTETGLSGR